MKYFNETSERVLEELKVDSEHGLASGEARARQEKYGKNEFTPGEEETLWDNIKDSLTEPMIIILLVAAAISALVGEFADTIGIVVAVALGITIGIVTEGKSKKAAKALSKLTEDIQVKVVRDGKVTTILKSDIVPGDIVHITTGDMIPADGRMIENVNLKVREDMLTGEADDVSKKADLVVELESIQNNKGETIIQDPVPAKQRNMVFGGTFVAQGTGSFVVTSIGDDTEMGRIAQNLNEDAGETPLQIKLGNLGTTISKVSSAIAGLLFIFMTVRMIMDGSVQPDTSSITSFLSSVDGIKTAFIVCIALIVAAVPEGLPTMINMTLAITMQKMAKINALVTKKEACETIGSISVICSDKTGTLTQNRMTVETVYVGGSYVTEPPKGTPCLFDLNCLLNGTADIEQDGKEFKYLGSATECALLLYYRDRDYREERKNAHIHSQIPFDSKLKRMSTVIKHEGKSAVLVKGAPEVLLESCAFVQEGTEIVPLTEEKKKALLVGIEKLQVKAMRALGFAFKYLTEEEVSRAIAEDGTINEPKLLEEQLVFNAFVGIRDPLREDVIEAVKTAAKAGITTKMLTGDNINTAKAIGAELGLLEGGKIAVESSYIDTLTDEELREEIKNINIVARSKPDTKMRIVTALQENGEVVGVTGDGINDAPALHKADVGIAMGIAGTEVSKNAADIILTDDSFSTIVRGIQWGRGIYENFQRFIQFQLTVNVVAFLIAVISQILDQPMPFTTIQLLWVNIIMDGPPALALGLEPVRRSVLSRKPVNRNSSIITKTMLKSIVTNAIIISAIILVQMIFNPLGADTTVMPNGASEMETVLFGLFAFFALFNAFNCREIGSASIIPHFFANTIALKVISITAVAQLIFTQVFTDFFNAVPLSAIMWGKVVLTAALIVVINEIGKAVIRTFSSNKKEKEVAKVNA
ncbi:calcium-translocating P-type ATPase, PMCA-type [Cellulosilyticum sp. ST5]|uniref:calcium-translocating P-type ATPase, PMCA-type n=1 Tax=Cellulosilyticum sp. ST5 TaxID=3055805 RepID=UPI0039778C00